MKFTNIQTSDGQRVAGFDQQWPGLLQSALQAARRLRAGRRRRVPIAPGSNA